MASALLNGLLHLLLRLAWLIGEVLFLPLIAICSAFFPNISATTIDSVMDFFSTKVFPIITWLKCLFLNVTGFPSALFSVLVIEILAFFTAAVAIRIIFLIYNLYYMIRGSRI